MLQSIGNKVKNAAEFVALAKGAWDIGRSIYHAGQAIAPVIGPAIGAALIYRYIHIY
jgi:predicted small secreted protein